jgi:non-heme chloroperoxidase
MHLTLLSDSTSPRADGRLATVSIAEPTPASVAQTLHSHVERWTERSGIRLRYLDNAPHDPVGLPLIFVPGLTDFADDYLQLLEFFTRRRTLVVEVRGRGQSDAPLTGYSVADHLADVCAVIDEEGFERFHLMTFSRGTSWSLELAIQAPQRVASFSIGDYQAVEVGMDDSFPESQWQARFRGVPIPQRVQRHVLDELQRSSTTRALWDELAALPMPILLAYGDQPGSLVDDAALTRYRTAVPDIEIVRFEGSAHDLFRADRLAYPRAVADFIARRTPGL